MAPLSRIGAGGRGSAGRTALLVFDDLVLVRAVVVVGDDNDVVHVVCDRR